MSDDLPADLQLSRDEIPDYFAAMGFREVRSDDAATCPDCGSMMTFEKKLQTEPMGSGAKITAYRCPDCMAIDWLSASPDVDPMTEKRGIMRALHMEARTDD
jgi:DNA-directed RNA polymerase subunit RPC12/RpoP